MIDKDGREKDSGMEVIECGKVFLLCFWVEAVPEVVCKGERFHG